MYLYTAQPLHKTQITHTRYFMTAVNSANLSARTTEPSDAISLEPCRATHRDCAFATRQLQQTQPDLAPS